ncbi:flavin-containing monooxygenase [Amycolatopsis suaedae]|uniref:FAD-dependent oxidoreductase n=1 Tax=Amycolatopsis suaedae TaxID=2510978 RepID=A0A4Q7J4H7_9PSEU|nr:NAD(P)/FAD-dependent oxidoreductase [Amycolatopsis suaedae]RZQ62471.1 FAD-dependent oxidoreductase [Amycolatopsis suaedae]
MEKVIVIGAGQAGLAAARALLAHGVRPLVLEAGPEATGSWPRYYDSLQLFSPAHINSLPGLPFPGNPNRFPTKYEVSDYLRDGMAKTDCELRTGTRVTSVDRVRGAYVVRTDCGNEFVTRAVVAATGQFDNPYRPELPALGNYTGTVLHAADYRRPEPFAGQRVVVVGAGNSAVQIAAELVEHAEVTLASRSPVQYATRKPLEPDAGAWFWKIITVASRIPLGSRVKHSSIPVIDIAGYRAAIEAGRPGRRPMFTEADGTVLRWPDGRSEHVDTILFATGYRPALEYLRPLGALDASGMPAHRNGISRTHPGLAFVGMEYQWGVLSASLYGVGHDARYVARRLTGVRSSCWP